MPDEDTFCDEEAVEVLVPLLVVPCQYIVPPEPPEAVNVRLPPHWLPPPETETEEGTELMVTLALPCAPQQPLPLRARK